MIGSFVAPSGKAALGVGKSSALKPGAESPLFSKTGGCFSLKSGESVLQGCFGCNGHASRFRHQLRIRIQRSGSKTRKLRCLLACEYLVTPRDLRDDGPGSLRGCRPGPDRYHRNFVIATSRSCGLLRRNAFNDIPRPAAFPITYPFLFIAQPILDECIGLNASDLPH